MTIQLMLIGTILVLISSLYMKYIRELSILVYSIALLQDNTIVNQVILVSAICVSLIGELDKETVVLYMIGVVGLLVVVAAEEYLLIYIGIELSGLAFYILAGREREGMKSTEAGVKYFVLGALGSGLMLLGMTLNYAQTGTTNIMIENRMWENETLILVGLFFKIGAAPFHMWVPDVYEGASTKITAYFAIVPKLAYLVIIMHLGSGIEQMIIGVISIVVGSIGAINQTSIKRMLAYSAIGHVGFMLLGLGMNTEDSIQAVMTYYIIYVIMTLMTFTIIVSLGVEKIVELRGLSRRNGVIGMTLGLGMMSIAGVPPLAGFMSKYLVIQSVIEEGRIEWGLVAILMSVISSFYYVRLIQYMYFEDKAEIGVVLPKISTTTAYVLGITMYLILTLLFYPSVLFDLF